MMTRDPHGADRQILSTGNNEYAVGLNDETEWQENMEDDDVPLDDEIADYFANPEEEERPLNNESGFDKNRIG